MLGCHDRNKFVPLPDENGQRLRDPRANVKEAYSRMILDGADLVAMPMEEDAAYAAEGLEPEKIEARQYAQVRRLTNKA